MMRLINANELRKTWAKAYLKIAKMVDEMPTIDAVPVVRCKDCKFNYANQIPSDDACQLCVELPISKDYFCAYGAIMDEDEISNIAKESADKISKALDKVRAKGMQNQNIKEDDEP